MSETRSTGEGETGTDLEPSSEAQSLLLGDVCNEEIVEDEPGRDGVGVELVDGD